MSSIQSPVLRKDARTAVLQSLSAGRRRRLLATLHERDAPVSMSELAATLAAAECETDPAAVSTDAARSVRLSLAHVHLPKLVDHDLVAWDQSGETVTLTDNPVHDDEVFADLVETEGEEWDDVISCLANERRRQLLAVLGERERALDRGEVAVEVAALEAGGEPSESVVRDVERDLSHVHLPKLDEVGLVDYDRDAATVAFLGHPELPDLDDL